MVHGPFNTSRFKINSMNCAGNGGTSKVTGCTECCTNGKASVRFRSSRKAQALQVKSLTSSVSL